MKYDFDKLVDRTGSDDIKHEALQTIWGRTDLLPLWVADMDFETPSFITEALKKRLEHSLFGYTKEPDDLWPSVIDWVRDHHQWELKPEWLTYIPGIVKGIGMVVNVFLKEDEKVIVQPPVYHPFFLTPEGNHRKVVRNPLRKLENGYYEMDFENLEKVTDEKCKLLILSNPHNPAGLCWSKDTLQRLAHFCNIHKILVISDEIHADLTLPSYEHHSYSTVSEAAREHSITFMAPSKAFNMPGLSSSYSLIFNRDMREKFNAYMEASELSMGNMFAYLSCAAAYAHGEDWLKQMLAYVQGNIDYTEQYLQANIPSISMLKPQASYLVFLDCRKLNLTQEKLVDLFVDKAHLALNDGTMFGHEGKGFMRLNVGCPRSILHRALTLLAQAVG